MKVSAAHYTLYSVMLGSDLHIATGKRPLRGGHFGVLTGRSWPERARWSAPKPPLRPIEQREFIGWPAVPHVDSRRSPTAAQERTKSLTECAM